MPWLNKRLVQKITLDKQATHLTQEEVGQVLYLEYCVVCLRAMDIKNIATKVFGEFQNVVLEQHGEYKMVRESN